MGQGDLFALAFAPQLGLGLAAVGGTVAVATEDGNLLAALRAVEDALHPRWVWWTNDTAATLVGEGLRVARCWDVAAVARLLYGGRVLSVVRPVLITISLLG